MSTQPEALRLADALESIVTPYTLESNAAAELRRLHADNKFICSALNGWIRENSPGGWIDDLRTQRNALLEALKLARSIIGHPDDAHTQMIDAVIKTVEGK